MGKLAVIGKERTLGEPRGARVLPDFGGVPVAIVDYGDHVTLYRHGLDEYVPPHRIDHPVHMQALAELGCDRVLAISSVGSLRPNLGVGAIVVPDDFIALHQPPVVAVEHQGQHVVPGFAPEWRERVLEEWTTAADGEVVDGGVYWQANGPRFETPAEVRMIAVHADVVGMTVASECVASNQLGIPYAAVCVVDNLANGLDAELLTREAYEQGQAANQPALLEQLGRVITALAR